MKNQQTIALVLGFVILGGVLGFKTLNVEKAEEEVGDAAMIQETDSRSLLDLVALGSDVKCSFSSTQEDGSVTEGEVMVGGGKSRTNYKATMTDGESVEGSSITDGEYSYIWGSGNEGGIKMKIQTVDNADATVSSEYVKPDRAMDYKCEPWSVDEEVFTRPSEIEFLDIAAMMDAAKIPN